MRAARRPDPNPERAAELRDLLSMPGADDRQVLDAAGRLLSDAVTGNAGSAGLARQVYALCLRWFDEDVKEAAPLLELFTGHHRDPEGGPPQADPELVGRLAEWLDRTDRASCPAGRCDRHLRRVQPAHARRALDRAGTAWCGSSRTACSPPRAAARRRSCGSSGRTAIPFRPSCGRSPTRAFSAIRFSSWSTSPAAPGPTTRGSTTCCGRSPSCTASAGGGGRDRGPGRHSGRPRAGAGDQRAAAPLA